jgi:hypothetical protein
VTAPIDAVSEWVRAFRLHEVTRAAGPDGRPAWVKRRRRGVDGLIVAGGALMKLANGGLRMFGSVARWQAWELGAFRLVHAGEPYRCGRAGPRGLWTHEVPGRSLREHAADGTLTAAMLRSAGAELRRAHALCCPVTRGAWSHGDPHLGNVLYDAAAGRARLIDFETQHEPSRAAVWRHADDLLTVGLELVGRTPADLWAGLFEALLDGYARPGVVTMLGRRLRHGSYAESLLWLARSPGSTAATLKRSLAALAAIAGERAARGLRPLT